MVFSPQVTGALNATMTLSDNAPDSPEEVGLSGAGVAAAGMPAVGLIPSGLAFGSHTIGTSYPSQTVTVTNSGATALTVTGMALSGTDPGDFAITADACSGATIPSGATCTISATFTATAVGSRTAEILLTDNAPASPQAFPLLGTGSTNNPVPFVSQPLVPSAVVPHGAGFTLTVNGAEFEPNSSVNWNGSPRPTTFVNVDQLTAAIPSTDIAVGGTATITVTTPAPGGGTSNGVLLPVTFPTPSVGFDVLAPLAPPFNFPVAAADFNGDGKPDLAFGLNYPDTTVAPNQLSIFLNSGSEESFQFSGPTNYNLLVPGAIYIASGDFNGDGKIDLAILATDAGFIGSSAVQILLGNGDGTFGAPTSFAAGSSPTSLLAADLNNDGKLDLAVANGSGTISIFWGNGDGRFQEGPELFVAGAFDGLLALSVGDLNEDGNLDLVVGGPFSDNVYVLFGHGDGTFSSPAPIATNEPPQGIAVADFNGDGKLDLAVTGGAAPVGAIISILRGNGDGTFASATDYPLAAGMAPVQAVVADFNGDGKPDIAVDSQAQAGHASIVSVLLGNGDGTFQPRLDFQATPPGSGTSSIVTQIAVGDFNQDGRIDLAAADDSGHGRFLLLAQPPVLSLSSAGLSFCCGQLVGATSAPQTVTLKNNGAGPINISSISITGTNSTEFAQTNDCPASLSIGASCSANVTFTSAVTGTFTATLTFVDDGPGSPQAVSLQGVAINPMAALSSSSLDFGTQTVGFTSSTQTLTLSNNGVGNLSISSVKSTGDFAQTNNCGSGIAAGSSCTIKVTFNPTTSGVRSGSLTITDNAASSPQVVALSGTGVFATLTLSATSLTFGSQPIGTTSAPQNITVTNSGSVQFLISKMTFSGDFSVANLCPVSPLTLTPGSSCTLSVTFKPTASGTRTGSISITDNASGSPQVIALTGTGTSSTVALSATSLTFAAQKVGTSSASQGATLTNEGSGPLTFSIISASGDFGQTNNCPVSPASLAAGGSCILTVTFTPTASGNRKGTLTINDNATASPQTVSLTGTGLEGQVSLSASALSFSGSLGVTTSSQTVTLTNTGNGALTISSLAAITPFADTTTCPVSASTLAASASCIISVTFTAGVVGTTYGSVTISDDGQGSPQIVGLTGSTSVSFSAPQVAGTTSAPQTITLTNASASAVTISGLSATGDFAVASNTCGTLSPGGSCSPMVTFKPTAGGTRTGSLVITDTSPGSPHMVALSGTGEDFAVTTTGQQSATVKAGGTATFTLSVASQGGFNQTVNLSCALPATMTHATCAVTPSSVTPSGATASTALVTITTTAPTMVMPQSRQRPDGMPGLFGAEPWAHRHAPLQMLWLLALGGLLAVAASCASPKWISAARRSSPLQLSRIALAVTLLVLLAWAACGGGAVVTHTPGTPAGTYTITLTATDPQAGLTQTATANLTVNP